MVVVVDLGEDEARSSSSIEHIQRTEHKDVDQDDLAGTITVFSTALACYRGLRKNILHHLSH